MKWLYADSQLLINIKFLSYSAYKLGCKSM